MALAPPPQAFIHVMDQEPVSTVVLPPVQPRRWILFLITMLNSKGIPEIIPVLPDGSLCSLLRVWLWSPFHSSQIISPIKTLKQVLIELNSLLASVRWLHTGSEVWGEGLRVNAIKLFSCSITWAEMKLLDGRWGWVWGACRKAGRCHQPQRTWELQVKEKPSSPSPSPTSGT